MNLLEWNINKRKKNFLASPFVYESISKQEADIICLVEYIDDKGIKDVLGEKYCIEESIAKSGNQILIAVSKQIAPNGIKLIRNTEEKNCYNILHISFTNNCNKNISVIGIRMLSPMDAFLQVGPLNTYLSTIKDSFICTGDFNIRAFRMKYWFPNFKIGGATTREQGINDSSILYTNGTTKLIQGFGAVDHVIGSDDLQITSEYDWDFIKNSKVYPQKNNIRINQIWDIKSPYPDHAMLISEITFSLLKNEGE